MTDSKSTESGTAETFFTAAPDATQGELASGYSQALTAALVANASYVGYLAYTQANGTMSLSEAREIVDQVASGNFTLSDLFGAAQSKTGPLSDDAIPDAQPKLLIGGWRVDLAAMLDGEMASNWESGSGSKTVFHGREYYTQIEVPQDWWAGWAQGEPVARVATFTLTNASFESDTPGLMTDGSWTFALPAGGDYSGGQVKVSITGDIDARNEHMPLRVAAGDGGDPDGAKFTQENVTNNEDGSTVERTLSYSSDDRYVTVEWGAPSGQVAFIDSIEFEFTYWF